MGATSGHIVVAAVMCGMSLFVGVLSLVICQRASSGKLKRNGYVGIRVPAVYVSEEAWRGGHRAALRFSWAYTALTAAVSAAVMVWASSAEVSPPVVTGAIIIAATVWTVMYAAVAGVVATKGAKRAPSE